MRARRNHRATPCLLHFLRNGVADRRSATWTHQQAVDLPRTPTAYRERQTKATPYLRWLKKRWALRADRAWRTRVKLEALTLRDFAFGPGRDAWQKAVREVQRPYPGTEGWLLSCSASEGGWGRWVGYGGAGFSYSLVENDTVGGNLQFRPSTFKGFYRHALDDVRSRGFRVVELDWLSGWRSALGQALAGGWGITHGMRSHWAGRGCW